MPPGIFSRSNWRIWGSGRPLSSRWPTGFGIGATGCRGKLHPLTDYNGDLHRFLVAQAPELDSIQFYSSTIIGKGTAIPANAGFQMISVGGPPEEYQLITRTLQRLLQEGLDYEITYRSIQGERWRIRQDSQGPERLD